MPALSLLDKRLGAVLLEQGFISDEDLRKALRRHAEVGGRLVSVLAESGGVSEEHLAKAVMETTGVPVVAIGGLEVTPEALKKVPAALAQSAGALAFKVEQNRLHVAFADPLDTLALAVVEDASGCCVVPYQAVSQELRWAIASYYPEHCPDYHQESLGALKEVVGEENALAAPAQPGARQQASQQASQQHLAHALREGGKSGGVTPLGEVLIALGYAAPSAVEDAMKRQRSGEGRLEDTLVESGDISPDMLARSVAAQLGYEYIEDAGLAVDPQVVALLPESSARRYTVMPLRLEGDGLVLAMKDPRHLFALDDIKLITGKKVIPAVASEETLLILINRFYRGDKNMEELAQALVREVGEGDTAEEDTRAIDENTVVKLVNTIIRDAVISDVSDVHIEPQATLMRIRVRKDGALREYMTMPRATASALTARIKIMGGLNIAERRLPQDGRVRFKDKSIDIDLRLSTLPTVYGEKVVMRILKKAGSIPEIESLGFADHTFQRFQDIIHKPYGMFLITGPTGSGKSFTSFSILKRIATPERNVTTIEDPVEYEIPGVNQTQVNVKAGMGFSRALRSFLRQDPDIIMVGEIRDGETAKTAVEAALTGHLLIATLHTNDAASAVTRLQEMGVEPFNVSASLLGVLAQRLVRKVCQRCKVEYTPEPEVLRRLGVSEAEIDGKRLARGVGCERCNGSGYNGRYAVHELLVSDQAIERAIVTGKSAGEIGELAVSRGMTTLRDDGVSKALQGITTLEEVLARTMA
ncbi:MAG: Flp pilus assembly complex ATPase component TadA [Deinococcota bacterium]|nr:Flp pilus assembly complex ATPase component TadA [Deinococcota bacterium]